MFFSERLTTSENYFGTKLLDFPTKYRE